MTRAARAKTQQYDESSIKRLKGLEGVRMRPTQYLGQRGDFMLFQAIKELWDNALDEFLAKRNKHIFVYADNKTQTYIVADRAQGIPVGLVPSDPKNLKSKKVSTLTLIFTEIHTGGKFDDKAYKTSKGTHGIGASATNAVSLSFEVWTRRENKWYYQKFSKGEPVADLATVRAIPADVKKCLNYDPKQGTIIRCVPDQSIVSADGGKTKARLSLSFTSSWLKDVAMLNPGIEITFSAQNKIKTYHNKDGLKYLIGKKLEAAEAEADGRLLEYNSESCRVALQWSSYAEADRMETYVCSGKTTENGEHEVGFRNALFKAVSEYKKKTDKFAPLDLYYGLIGIFDYHMSGAEYSGQTKNKLVSNVAGEIEKELLPQFKAFFVKNKTLARSIIRRAVEIKKSKEAFKTAVKNAQEAKQRTKASLPPGLVAAPKATAATRELYLVEGDSAAGTAKRARDLRFQEVMKLDGKPPNSIRARPHQLIGNKKIQNILAAIGYNFDAQKKDVDPYKNLRIKSLLLLPDADADGDHICVLILTLIYKLLPRLFDEGRVFIVDAPLYSAYYKGKRYFGDNHAHVLKQLPRGAPKNIIMRAKGWGEIGHETLAHVAFDVTSRRLIQIPKMTAKEAKRFEHLMGDDASVRKELLGL